MICVMALFYHLVILEYCVPIIAILRCYDIEFITVLCSVQMLKPKTNQISVTFTLVTLFFILPQEVGILTTKSFQKIFRNMIQLF